MSQLTGERKSDEVFVDESGYTWMRLQRSWRPGPVPKNIVEQVKRRFLIHMAATNIVWKSARYAGVSAVTIHAWRRRGIISDAEVAEALERYLKRVGTAM